MKNNRWFLAAVPFAIVVAGLFLIYIVAAASRDAGRNARDIGLENNTYVQVVVCVSSVSPTQRTPEYVKYCYEAAENANHTKVERYGHGK